MELAVALDIPVREMRLTLADAQRAEELFLCNSLMEVLPVVRIARQAIGNEKVGETTRKLAVAYTQCVNEECIRG